MEPCYTTPSPLTGRRVFRTIRPDVNGRTSRGGSQPVVESFDDHQRCRRLSPPAIRCAIVEDHWRASYSSILPDGRHANSSAFLLNSFVALPERILVAPIYFGLPARTSALFGPAGWLLVAEPPGRDDCLHRRCQSTTFSTRGKYECRRGSSWLAPLTRKRGYRSSVLCRAPA